MEVEGRSKPLSQEQCVEAQSLWRAWAMSARPPVQQGRGRSFRAVCPAARLMAPLAIGHHKRGGGAQWTLSLPRGICSSPSIVHPDGAPVSVLEASFPAPPCRTRLRLSPSLWGVRGHWLWPCLIDHTVSSLGSEAGSW